MTERDLLVDAEAALDAAIEGLRATLRITGAVKLCGSTNTLDQLVRVRAAAIAQRQQMPAKARRR